VRGFIPITNQIAAVRRAQGPGELELTEPEEGRGYRPETLIAYLLGEIETTGSGI
jgi:hypothetical protein